MGASGVLLGLVLPSSSSAAAQYDVTDLSPLIYPTAASYGSLNGAGDVQITTVDYAVFLRSHVDGTVVRADLDLVLALGHAVLGVGGANDSGLIGASAIGPDGLNHGYVLDGLHGGYVDLGPWTQASQVLDDGSVIGNFSPAGDGSDFPIAGVWTAADGWDAIPVPPGCGVNVANDEHDFGGVCDYLTGGPVTAFLLDRSGVFTNFGTPSGGGALPIAITSDGRLWAESDWGVYTASTASPSWTQLPMFPAFTGCSHLQYVTPAGLMYGWLDPTCTNELRGFLWNPASTELTVLEGPQNPDGTAEGAVVYAANDHGQAAGSIITPTNEIHAAFWERSAENTPVGSPAVDLGDGVHVDFSNVTTSGSTSISTSINGPPMPANFALSGIYYEVSSTAAFDGASVCFFYDDTGLTPGEEAQLSLLHYEGGTWTDVTGSRDSSTNTVCGNVSHFSPFALAVHAKRNAHAQGPKPR